MQELHEIGVDPGIDHLYAIKAIDKVHADGIKLQVLKEKMQKMQENW